MSIKSDRWITRLAREHRMIEPFSDRQIREGVVSYGVSSYGYDVRIADDFKIFTNINSTVIDPKHFDSRSFVDFRGDVCVIPPNSFALARTVEYFRIPRNVLVVCLGKCLAGDTEVVDGSTGALKSIREFGAGQGATASLNRGQVRKSHVSEGRCQGVLPTYEITTRTGRRLRATPNHPLLTFEGWRAVQDLRPGDRVSGCRAGLPCSGIARCRSTRSICSASSCPMGRAGRPGRRRDTRAEIRCSATRFRRPCSASEAFLVLTCRCPFARRTVGAAVGSWSPTASTRG